MLRSYLKNATAHAVSWTRLDALAHVRLHRQVPFVVAYHRVVERVNACGPLALPAMEISVAMLTRHLEWLGRHFHLISLDDLSTALERPPKAKPLAAITFDDGYGDVFHHAFPLLKRKGIPAAMFVVTDLVNTSELPIHERLHATLVRAWSQWTSPRSSLSELLGKTTPPNVSDPFSATRFLFNVLTAAEVEWVMESLDPDHHVDRILPKNLEPLSWEMLAAMRDSGMTIGSHSKTHAFLANENDARVREEAGFSRLELQRRLGVDARCFAYPGGSFTAEVVEAVASAGYEFGFTICRHRHPRHRALTIPRTGLWEQSCLDSSGRFSQAIMSSQAAGTFRFISRCRQRHQEGL